MRRGRHHGHAAKTSDVGREVGRGASASRTFATWLRRTFTFVLPVRGSPQLNKKSLFPQINRPKETHSHRTGTSTTQSDANRRFLVSSECCGNGCSFYVFETGEQIERWSYFFIVS
jgi:hypothetical protein